MIIVVSNRIPVATTITVAGLTARLKFAPCICKRLCSLTFTEKKQRNLYTKLKCEIIFTIGLFDQNHINTVCFLYPWYV